MSYRIGTDEPAAAGLRRCVIEQVDKAREHLGAGLAEDPATAVHEARKALKRARSGLRMGREAFGRRRVRAELDALRARQEAFWRARPALFPRGRASLRV